LINSAFLANSLKICLVHLGILVNGGSGLLIVVKYSGSRRKNLGYVAACGITLAAAILIVMASAGVLTFISNDKRILTVVKSLFCGYLVLLSMKSLREAIYLNSLTITRKSHAGRGSAFLDGLISTLLNPHAILYFSLFFSSVVKEETNLCYIFLYGIQILSITFFWFLGISKLFSIDLILDGYLKNIRIFKSATALMLMFAALSLFKR
jgi:threonine/homoserine/homoserine lactone efflux protein